MNGFPRLAEDGEFYCSAHKGTDTREYNRYIEQTGSCDGVYVSRDGEKYSYEKVKKAVS